MLLKEQCQDGADCIAHIDVHYSMSSQMEFVEVKGIQILGEWEFQEIGDILSARRCVKEILAVFLPIPIRV
jgi:hypothetical protein